MFKKTRLAVLVAASLLIFNACTLNNNIVSSLFGIIVSPKDQTQWLQNNLLEFTVKNPQSFKTFEWHVKDEQGISLDYVCSGLNTAKMSCIFPQPETVKIAVYLVDRNDKAVSYTLSIAILQPPADDNQPPVLVLKVSNNGSKTAYATISSDPSKNAGKNQFPTQTALKFDFTGTIDEDKPNLTYAINYGTGNGFEPVASSFVKTFPTVGVYSWILKATDSDGKSTYAPALVYLQCPNPQPWTFNMSKLVVQPHGTKSPNLYDYVFQDGIASGGGVPSCTSSTCEYLILKGDGTEITPFSNKWTKTGKSVDYTVYRTKNSDQRDIQFMVLDLACFTIGVSPVVQRSFPMTTPACMGDVLYAEGHLSGVSHPLLSVNGDYLATSVGESEWKAIGLQESPAQIRVLANPKKVGANPVSVTASSEKNGYNGTGGLSFRVDNINPNIANGGASVVFNNVTYKVPAGPDGIPAQTYTQTANSTCTGNLTVTKQTAMAPCDSGPAVPSETITVCGTLNCTNLENKDGKRINFTDGTYYLQWAASDVCVGGGGGGGGEPPPDR